MAPFIKFTEKKVTASATTQRLVYVNAEVIAKAVYDPTSSMLQLTLTTKRPSGQELEILELHGKEAEEAIAILQQL
jgi:hypothetical protein